jgi:hypothetical protein
MRRFSCACGSVLFFENRSCGACGRTALFLPEPLLLVALEPVAGSDGLWTPAGSDAGQRHRSCANERHGCNWAVPESDPSALCSACRLTVTIPDLRDPRNAPRWELFEAAKRRVLYTLGSLGYRFVDKQRDPELGLAFEFLADPQHAPGTLGAESIPTGHHDGLITVNVAEADPVTLVRAREALGESYRTPLGHLRHEIGHYFWYLRIRGAERLAAFRALFGDERTDYRAAIDRHYAQGPPADWIRDHVSPYAAAHPWEDWAESCAHYLHIVDTVETGIDFGFVESVPRDLGETLGVWMELSVAINCLNQSLGLEDAYPFVLTDGVRKKLYLVDEVIRGPAQLFFDSEAVS